MHIHAATIYKSQNQNLNNQSPEHGWTSGRTIALHPDKKTHEAKKQKNINALI